MRTDCIFEELYKTRTEPFSSIITGGAPWCHMVFILSSNTPVCTQHSPSLGSRVHHNIAPVRPVLHFQHQHEIKLRTEKISLAVRDGVGDGVAVLGCISIPPAASASPCLARYVDLHQLQWGLAVASQQQDCKKTEFISLLLLCSPLQSWKLALTAPAAIYKFVTGVCAAQ